MARIVVAVVVALVAGGILPLTRAAAQDDFAALSPEVRPYLPAAETLGDGWTVLVAEDPGASPLTFRSVARVVYAGPAGARIVFFAWTTTGVAARDLAWQATSTLMDEYRAALAPDLEGIDVARVQSLPPPVGCLPYKWAEGLDFRTDFVAGLTLCAAEPNVLLLAVVSGDLGGMQGAAASNQLIEQALAAGSGAVATPAARAT